MALRKVLPCLLVLGETPKFCPAMAGQRVRLGASTSGGPGPMYASLGCLRRPVICRESNGKWLSEVVSPYIGAGLLCWQTYTPLFAPRHLHKETGSLQRAGRSHKAQDPTYSWLLSK